MGFFLFCPGCFLLPVPRISTHILPLHYTSSPSSRQHHSRAAAPRHQKLTVPTSQQLFPPKSSLAAVPGGNYASFLICIAWSEEPDWLTGTKMTFQWIRESWIHVLPPTQDWELSMWVQLKWNWESQKVTMYNIQVHYQDQLSAIKLIWSTTSHQKSSLDRSRTLCHPASLMSQLCQLIADPPAMSFA